MSNSVCGAGPQSDFLVGDVCTAEMISIPSLSILSETLVARPIQKILFLLIPLAVILLVLFTRTTGEGKGFTWFNQRQNLVRGGPSPNHVFLPYLHATHGW